MQTTKSKSVTKLKLAEANARAALALALSEPGSYIAIAMNLGSCGEGPPPPLQGIGLAIAIVRDGYEPTPEQFAEARKAARQLRLDAFNGNGVAEYIDEAVFWWLANHDKITPAGRALVRASGHRTYSGLPCRREPQPRAWIRDENGKRHVMGA